MHDNINFTFKAIGHIESEAKFRYEAPRQSVYANCNAFLRWDDKVFAECAADLAGFDRVWLIWVFDRNPEQAWKPRVRVPVPAEKERYSLFSTRSPYRPNPVGISAVELLDISPAGLQLGNCDLLDGTAVLDVKPYIPEVDAFPDSRAGWRDRVEKEPCRITYTQKALRQIDYILQNGGFDLKNFCSIQLSFRPLDRSRKRLEIFSDEGRCILHFRTWKIFFEYHQDLNTVNILFVESNYSASDLAPETSDRYGDKELHRDFLHHEASGFFDL